MLYNPHLASGHVSCYYYHFILLAMCDHRTLRTLRTFRNTVASICENVRAYNTLETFTRNLYPFYLKHKLESDIR